MNLRRALLFTSVAALVLLSAPTALAQPKSGLRLPEPLDAANARKAGQELVAGLLSQEPAEKSFTTGTLTSRGRDRSSSSVQVEFSIEPSVSNTVHRYIARDQKGGLIHDLRVVQTPGQPNSYTLAGGKDEALRPICGDALMQPFAGSEFWIADLGLEFLHWPRQMVTGKEMSRGQFCEVLESRPEQPFKNGYSKVVSWIASQRPGIVLVKAEAYDSAGKLIKQFEPKSLQKVQGQWQLQRMQIYNRQTGVRSTIEFDLGREPASP